MTDRDGAFWVFGYGSLMWRPGFDYLERVRAVCHGYHRQACVLSITYRGTRDRPGLVVGMAPGGSCKGIAYRVAPDKIEQTVAYLDERELVTDVYKPRMVAVTLADGRRLKAHGYVVDTRHDQYFAGTIAEQAAVVRGAKGREGTSREYIANVVAHLDEMGIADGPMHALIEAVDGG